MAKRLGTLIALEEDPSEEPPVSLELANMAPTGLALLSHSLCLF